MRPRVDTASIKDAICICLDSFLVGINRFIINGNGIVLMICKNANSDANALEDAGNGNKFLVSPSV